LLISCASTSHRMSGVCDGEAAARTWEANTVSILLGLTPSLGTAFPCRAGVPLDAEGFNGPPDATERRLRMVTVDKSRNLGDPSLGRVNHQQDLTMG
jgi:hypothetical protein